MGFFADYEQIIIYSKMELILICSRNDTNMSVCNPSVNMLDNAFTPLTRFDIKLDKISWRIAHVDVADIVKLKLLKILGNGKPIVMLFRTWEYYKWPNVPHSKSLNWQVKTASSMEKPLYVITGFQIARRDVATTDCSKFDLCNPANA